ncbi:MAG: response regulator [Chloroflexi bacterium]|uniref:Response regulator n=1 Tax=Candidatus Chlorohelix allophototropha TaxID=3003348 RepID=A0A8T7LZA9_9CHLR|nr:response regulator [Chloroflexota bacterium]WJW66195.1 response regulator [Chloroflexota bacterium L227-S17]
MSEKMLEKILLVEDEVDIQVIAQIALERIGGFKLKVCKSGKEALQVIPDFMPDLVLLDVMMPEMDGPTTLKHMRANPLIAGIPVIFMTAKVQPQEISQYTQIGAIGVISKPFDPMMIASNIKDLWRVSNGG